MVGMPQLYFMRMILVVNCLLIFRTFSQILNKLIKLFGFSLLIEKFARLLHSLNTAEIPALLNHILVC